MAHRYGLHELRTVLIDKPIYAAAHEAAYDQITCHVRQFLGVYRGNLWELAIACYMQGLMDAAQIPACVGPQPQTEGA